MSKLINTYKQLKENDSETFYLFKSGIFYIFLDEDAKKMNSILNLKLTNLNNDIVKCGFPTNSISKYINLLISNNIKFKIIDLVQNTMFDLHSFTLNNELLDLLNLIANVDENSLSVKESYDFIEKIKFNATNILNKNNQ